ncbi:MAG: 30S ribosomal protein S6 [Alphaproteobacteria bacterium]|nr:MAG: 30S ribosomal protein S6 [Alphaproteobacteria bacterium]
MPFYEHVFLARQDVPTAQVDAIIEEVGKIVQDQGGTVTKSEYWGLKPLAYRIKKNRKAHFVLMNLDTPPETVAELERRARIHDDIIRYLTVRVDKLEDGPSAMMRSKDRDRRGDRGGRPRR